MLMVHMICDDCGRGLMLQEGNEVSLSHPPQFKHKCNNCGIIKYYRRTYPHQRMVPLEELRNPLEDEIG